MDVESQVKRASPVQLPEGPTIHITFYLRAPRPWQSAEPSPQVERGQDSFDSGCGEGKGRKSEEGGLYETNLKLNVHSK